MPIKIDIQKVLKEMRDLERKKDGKGIRLYLSEARLEEFRKVCWPADPSPVLDYLMECVIRGSKAAKGKK